jgi:hypothetical protein
MERWKDGKMERWKDGKMESAGLSGGPQRYLTKIDPIKSVSPFLPVPVSPFHSTSMLSLFPSLTL